MQVQRLELKNLVPSFWRRILLSPKKRNEWLKIVDSANERLLSIGNRITIIQNANDDLTGDISYEEDILSSLRGETTVAAKCKLLADKDSDFSMAVWSFVNLVNQGVETHFVDLQGKNIDKDVLEQWNNFVKNCNYISETGLDGIIKQLAWCSVVLNGMAVEFVVGKGKRPSRLYIIDTSTFTFKSENVNGENVWKIYQQDENGNEVSLEKANLFYVPSNPKPDDPRGTYLFEAAISAIDFKINSYITMDAIIARQGYPRNDISIDTKAIRESLPNNKRNDPKEIKSAIENAINEITTQLNSLTAMQDFIHDSSISVNQTAGASNAARSIDIRAYTDMTDTQVMNGLKMMAILLNRVRGTTETWGSVQYKVVIEQINAIQRDIKRLLENVGTLWLQSIGKQGYLKVDFKPTDFENELQKWNAQNAKDTHFATAQEKGWLTREQAGLYATGEAIKNKGDK